MNQPKALAIICCLVLACGVLVPAARADQWNQQTKMSFNQPIEIPGSVLPAGTYWFVLSSNTDRNVVQIYSENWSRLYASLITIPIYRSQSTAKTEVEFAERPHQNAQALWEWYYPSRLAGHEFVYRSKNTEMRMSSAAKRDILARPMTSSAVATSGE